VTCVRVVVLKGLCLCHAVSIFYVYLQMKSELSYSYEGLFFNFLAGLFIAVFHEGYNVMLHYRQVGSGDESLVYLLAGILNVHFTA